MKFVYVIFFVIWFTSCRTNSKYEEKYDTGELKLSGTIEDGLRVGIWNQYDIHSNLTFKYYYHRDTLLKKEFYTNNSIFKEEEVLGDLKHGTSKTYFNTGELESISNFLHGKQTGKVQMFYKSGQLKTDYIYSDSGYPEGLFKQYYPNGVLNIEASDFGNSVQSYFDKNGKLQLSILFKEYAPVDTIHINDNAIEILTLDMEALKLPE